MKRIVFIALLLASVQFAVGQNITAVEYFLDSDPGCGNGTAVAVTPAAQINDLAFEIDLPNEAEGFHTLFIRAQDDGGTWSLAFSKPFYKLSASVSSATQHAINKVEYFIDSDPGFGAGADVPVAPAESISGQEVVIPLDLLSDGFHVLFLRAQDEAGSWSTVFSKPFYKLSESVSSATPHAITKVEYFIDSDPGFGAGTDVPVASAVSISGQQLFIPLDAVTNGFHVLFMRTQDDNGSWSMAFARAFYKLGSESVAGLPNITRIEYFIGDDPGFGAGTEVSITAATSISDLSFPVSVGSLAQGDYTLSVRAQDANGKWSLIVSQPFTTCNQTPPSAVAAEAINANGFTATWAESPGSVSYELELTTDNFATLATGFDPMVISAPASSAEITGLSEGTTYQFRVKAVATCASVPSNNVEVTTFINPPSAQPTNLAFTSLDTDSYTVYFTPATGSPTGYLAIRKKDSPPTFAPSNDVVYTQGQSVADGEVVAYIGSEALFDEAGLQASTQYYYSIYAYKQSGDQISYLQQSPLVGDVSTLSEEPISQASNLEFDSIDYDGYYLSFNASESGADGYLVLRHAGSQPTAVPADGLTYTASIGSDQVAFHGADTSFVETGLSEATTYYYSIYAYNGDGDSINYFTASPLTGSETTKIRPPVFSAETDVTQNQFTIHWTLTTGATDYRLDVSTDNFMTRLPGFDDRSVSGTSFTITGLDPGTLYQYQLRAITGEGSSIDSDVMEQVTVPVAPGVLAATDIGQSSFTSHWSDVNGAADYLVDVAQDELFASILPDYDGASAGDATSLTIQGLTPGLTYYYRVRANNEGGTSPVSEVSTGVLLLPATPLALDAANVTSTSFKAKWEAVPNVSEYLLDVTLAVNDFNPSLTGYSGKSITGFTEELITNLLPNTVYKYRVSAVNASGASPPSVPVSVSTFDIGSGTPVALGTPVYSESFVSENAAVSVAVSGGTPPYSLIFNHRKITEADFTSMTVTSSGTTTYEVTVDGSMLDEIGVEFFFRVTDANGLSDESGKHYIYLSIQSGEVSIPFTRFGGAPQAYEIFSIPYALEDNLIASIFDEMGEYDKSKWRLVRYQGGKNVDYGAGINRIEPGKGYWFNRRDNTKIQIAAGTSPQVNQSKVAFIALEPGWNEIGNPLPFDLDWDDILEANPDIDLIGNLRVFNPEGFHLNDESNVLKTWSGGFVHNGSSGAVQLKVPVVLKNSAGGRIRSNPLPGSSLDQPQWFIPITVKQSTVETKTVGIGMYPDASLSIDELDDFVVPRFLNYVEFYTRHDDFFTPKFSRDFVPTVKSYTWEFTFESNNMKDPVTLSWLPDEFGLNDARLFLFDVSQNALVDMRTTGQYQFDPHSSKWFRFTFASSSQDLDVTMTGKAYPNPFNTTVTMPVLTGKERQPVSITITDLLGRPVRNFVSAVVERGFHEFTWDGADESGSMVSAGVYLYRVEVNKHITTGRIIKK